MDNDDEPPPPEVTDYGEPGNARIRSESYTPTHLSLAHGFIKAVRRINPIADRIAQARPEAWANELRLLVEDTGMEVKLLADLLPWVLDHARWRLTIQSPHGLRSNIVPVLKDFRAWQQVRANH